MNLPNICYLPRHAVDTVTDWADVVRGGPVHDWRRTVRVERDRRARARFAYEAHCAASNLAEWVRVELMYADDPQELAELNQALEGCGLAMARTLDPAFGGDECACHPDGLTSEGVLI